MSVKINKNGKEYDLGFVPQSLYDDVENLKKAVDDILSALMWEELLSTALTTSEVQYTLSKSISNYKELIIAVAWLGGANSNWITIPIINGGISVTTFYVYLNNLASSDAVQIKAINANKINALGSNANCWLRVYAR